MGTAVAIHVAKASGAAAFVLAPCVLEGALRGRMSGLGVGVGPDVVGVDLRLVGHAGFRRLL